MIIKQLQMMFFLLSQTVLDKNMLAHSAEEAFSEWTALLSVCRLLHLLIVCVLSAMTKKRS